MVGIAGSMVVTPHGRTSWRRRASVKSSSMVIVDLRLVRPVTTAIGKLAGGATVGVGMAVGSSDGDALPEGTRLGLEVAHPTSRVRIATAVTPRSVAGGFTALS
jgi:hypothetical protein